MTSRRAEILSILMAAVVCCAVCACSTKRRDWVDEDGSVLGEVVVESEGEGYRYEYTDASGLVMRVERRDAEGELNALFPVEHYRYDDARRPVGLRYTDAEDRRVAGEGGFARLLRIHRREGGLNVVDETFFGLEDEATTTSGGVARVETQLTESSEPLRIRYYGPGGERICTTVDDTPDVCELRFKSLRGVRPIVYKTLFSETGEPIKKTRVKGLIRLRVSTTSRQSGASRRSSISE